MLPSYTLIIGVCRIEPAYVQSKMSLASALFDTGGEGQEEEGLALMRGAVKLDPLNANVHHNLGTLLSRQGQCTVAQRGILYLGRKEGN